MYNYSISKKHVNMIEIILARSNQLVIQLNSLASVPTPLGRTCINRRSVQNGHSTLSPGNPEWPELTVHALAKYVKYHFVQWACFYLARFTLTISPLQINAFRGYYVVLSLLCYHWKLFFCIWKYIKYSYFGHFYNLTIPYISSGWQYITITWHLTWTDHCDCKDWEDRTERCRAVPG